MSDQIKVLLAYDVNTADEIGYRRFVTEEFLPQAQELGLTPTDAWHTAFGDYPSRLIGLVGDDLDGVQRARGSDQWQTLVKRLGKYTSNLHQRVIPLRPGFQW